MGLDIYLSSKDEGEADKAHNEAWNAFYEHPDYDSWSDEERNARRALLPEYVSKSDKVKSAKHPEHYMNPRYLRSSYNDGGFNAVMRDMIGKDGFYWIFEPLGRDWYEGEDSEPFTAADLPNFAEARKRAEEVLGLIQGSDVLRTMDATMFPGEAEHMWHDLPTEAQVLDWYRKEKAKHHGDKFGGDGGYSNAKGLVLGFDKGVEVLALTVGKTIIGTPCAIAVYRPSKEVVDHYVQTTDIVIEFIDEAVRLINEDGAAYIMWSG